MVIVELLIGAHHRLRIGKLSRMADHCKLEFHLM
jgi:hypothetical protein